MKASPGVILAAGALFTALCAHGALCQTYPSRPIHMTIQGSPGGSNDVAGRLLAPVMAESMGQAIVPENRFGGGGTIGSTYIAKALPDGYNFMFGPMSGMITAKFLLKESPFDAEKDFTPIGPAIEPVEFMVASSASSIITLKDLIDQAKRNPNKLAYGTTGIGSVFHLEFELLSRASGIALIHVPYKGTPPAMQDVIGGRLDMTFGTVPSTSSLIGAKKLRVIAVSTEARFEKFPDVPTIREIVAGYQKPPSGFSFWGPAGLPQPIVRRLNAEILKALESPQLKKWLDDNGFSFQARTPEEVAALQRTGLEIYRQAIELVGLKPQ